MAIVKTVLRVAVIAGLATGAAVVVAGPARVGAMFSQARQAVVTEIDKHIDDPVALRAQLRELEGEYPKRISEVRSDLAELEAQLSELKRDKAVSEKVVEMAQNDLAEMKDVLARAESARVESPAAIINVRHDNSTFSLDQAYSRATQINGTLTAYLSRTADADRDIGFLEQQQQRLTELLTQLETERTQFQAQIWQLDGQIEMIARNDKLIEIVQRRQEAISKYDKYEGVSLEQITGRMAKIRAEQESRLQSLASQTKTKDYESRAKAMLDAETAAREVFNKAQQVTPARQEKIEIGPSPTPGFVGPSMPGMTPSSTSGCEKVAAATKIVVQ